MKCSYMDQGSKILLLVFGVLIGSGILAVVFFSQGSIIGEPGSAEPCEWTVTQTEDNETFTDFEDLNATLQDELGDNWQRFYDGTEVRKNPETGVIEDRLAGNCQFTGSLDVGDSQ